LQPGDIVVEGIQQARFFPERSPTLGEVAAFAKQAFKDNARMRLRRQRRRGRGPGKIVLVGAGIAVSHWPTT